MTQHEHLYTWIATATRGLPESVSQRFADEIGDHYEELLQRYAADGIAPDLAQANALRQLGDAGETAKQLCDAHFSRRSYHHAFIAVIVFIALALTTLGFSIGAQHLDEMLQPNFIQQPLQAWQIFAHLAHGALLIVIMHGTKKLLHEGYDIRIATTPWRVCIGLVLISACAGSLYALGSFYTTYIDWTHPFWREHWADIANALLTVSLAATLVFGALIAGCAIRQLRQRPTDYLRLILILVGLSGLALCAFQVMILMESLSLPTLSYATYLIRRFMPVIALSAMLPFAALLVASAAAFWSMRRLGAVLA